MKVLVCGSRKFTLELKALVYRTLDGLTLKPTIIIHGGATGVDSIATHWGMENNVNVVIYQADWKSLGKHAGPIRNGKMLVLGKPDLVLAFPGSLGTADMVRQALAAGVPVDRIDPSSLIVTPMKMEIA